MQVERLSPLGRVDFGPMRSGFPLMLQPPMDVVDFLAYSAPEAMGANDGLKFDPLFGCAYCKPVFVPHNQTIASCNISISDQDDYINGSLPTVEWEDINISNTTHGLGQEFAMQKHNFQHAEFQCKDLTAAAAMTFEGNTESIDSLGAIVYLSHHYWPYASAASKSFVEVTFEVLADDDDTEGDLYKVRLSASESPTIWINGELAYGNVKTGANAAKTQANAKPADLAEAITIEALVMNGKIALSVSGGTAPVVMRLTPPQGLDVTFVPRIGKVYVTATGWTQFGAIVQPMCWQATGSFRSTPQQFGFVPNRVYYHVYSANEVGEVASGGTWAFENPPGPQVTVTAVAETLGTSAPQYDLEVELPVHGTYQGTDYCYNNLPIARVVSKCDGIWERQTGVFSTAWIGTGDITPVMEWQEEWNLDIESLNFNHNAQLTLNNWYGISALANTWGIRGVGNIAVAAQMGYAHTGTYRRFYGYCPRYEFLRSSPSEALLRLTLRDQMTQIGKAVIPAPPNFDGQNHYWVMARLAMFAGLSPDQLAFASLVPPDPFGVSPVDTEPYFLPVGQGINAWTPVNRTVPVLYLMDQIRKLTGHVLYIGVDGMLYYHAFVPSSPALPIRTFTEWDDNQYTPISDGVFPTGIHSLRIVSDTENVRNQFLLMGIDSFSPDWSVIVEKREDIWSIDAPAPFQPVNYVGFKQPFIWSDSRFASAEFASAAADRLFRFMRLPEFVVELETWHQPDLRPLDCINVLDYKSNSLLPFFVTGLRHMVSNLNREKTVQKSWITARYLDASLYLP